MAAYIFSQYKVHLNDFLQQSLSISSHGTVWHRSLVSKILLQNHLDFRRKIHYCAVWALIEIKLLLHSAHAQTAFFSNATICLLYPADRPTEHLLVMMELNKCKTITASLFLCTQLQMPVTIVVSLSFNVHVIVPWYTLYVKQ